MPHTSQRLMRARTAKPSPPPVPVVRCFRKRDGLTGYLCCENTWEPWAMLPHLAHIHQVATLEGNIILLRALKAFRQEEGRLP